ncbi:MAG: ATP-binding protein [Acidimicrobiales bacterium]|nr:ATP-binding protein [Acidimicrobiales bacterium]
MGRTDELAVVAFARDRARAGRGSVLAVRGDAGIGKTWFLEAVQEQSAAEGFTTGWGSGWPVGTTPPLWPWRQALAEACGPSVSSLLDPNEWGGDSDERARFQRYVEVLDAVREAVGRQPAVVLLDDAHAGGEITLEFARFVGRHARSMHLVVVVAYRPASGRAGELLAGLEGDGRPLTLRGLDRAEIATVLDARGPGSLADEDLDFITRGTGGHPRSLEKIVAAGDPVRALVEERLEALPEGTRHVATHAAVLDDAGATAAVAAVADLSLHRVARALADLEAVGLVKPQGRSRAFAHASVPAVLVDALTDDEVLEIHARAAEVLRTTFTAAPERVAAHALAAGPRSEADARRAVSATLDAARALTAEHRHAQAVELFEEVRDVHRRAGLGPVPAAVRAAHATAVLGTGHLAAARELCAEAVSAAEAEGDIPSLAEAALGYGGVWLSEMRSPLDYANVLGLQRRALDGLPAEEAVLRRRLEARITAEKAYRTGRPELMSEVLDVMRAEASPEVLAEALSLYHHTLLGPEHADARLPVARELLAAATAADHGLLSLMGLLWLTVDLFLAGDPYAVRSLGSLGERVDDLGCQGIGYIADVMEVMLLARAGRFDEAEEAATAVFEKGTEVGDADAVAYYGSQLVMSRWLQGRSAEVLDLVADTAASPTLTAANHAFTAVFAALAADCGELDQARAALARFESDGLHAVPSGSAWLMTLFCVAEAAHTLGEADLAEEAAALLEPYADLPVMGSLAVVCAGSARRPLGLAALTAGDHAGAVEQLRLAVAASEQLGNRPMAALTRADLATALLGRGGPHDRAAAADELDHAIREGSATGLGQRLDEWRSRRRDLDAPIVAASPAIRPDAGVIHRQGGSWILEVAEHEVVVPDLVGMQYLVLLFTHPGREIAAIDLMHQGSATVAPVTAGQPVLDAEAVAQYRQRVSEIEDELAEAEQFADSERATRARVELDAVIVEIERSTNIFGAPRSFTDQAERARTAVSKAIRRAFDHIDEADSLLGGALRRSVRTGRQCCYEPGPGAPSRWVVRPSDSC